MNNEEKNPSLNEDAVEENNDIMSEEPQSPKKPSSGLLTIIITLVACVLVAVIMIIALLPKNNGGDNNQNNNENSGETGDDQGTGDEGTGDGGSGNEGTGNEGTGNEGTGNEGTGNEEDTKVRYTVTVVDENGNAVSGVDIHFYPEGGVDFPKTTDAEGKAIYTTAKKITVAVTSIPDGFKPYDKLNEKQSFDADGNLTITLTKAEVVVNYYYVLVIDQNDNPIPGVMVQICGDVTGCKMPQLTDENGKAAFTYNEGENYHAQLTQLPDGYTVGDVSAYYDIVDDVATIKLTKI